jgi:uncharacterized repeat protein (TIGR02543 family)
MGGETTMTKNLYLNRAISAVVIAMLIITAVCTVPLVTARQDAYAADGDSIALSFEKPDFGAPLKSIAGYSVIPISPADTANKIVPVTNFIAGPDKFTFNIVGKNQDVWFTPGNPAVAVEGYIPIEAYAADIGGGTSVVLADHDEIKYPEYLFSSPPYGLDVTRAMPGTYKITVYFAKYSYTSLNGWEVDDYDAKKLYSQELTYVVNGTLVYDANGGKGGSTVYVPHNSKHKLPTVTKSGYKFKGWYTAKWGGTKLSNSKTVSFSKDSKVTVYAQWEKNVKIKFNLAKGKLKKGAKNSATVKLSSKYGKLPAPTRTGYKLWGWFSGSTKVTASSYVQKAKAHTLTAKWIKKGKDKYISKAEYKEVKKGMTYAQAKYAIGGAGVVGKQGTNADGSKYKIYVWFAAKGDTKNAAALLFEGGKLTEKQTVGKLK